MPERERLVRCFFCKVEFKTVWRPSLTYTGAGRLLMEHGWWRFGIEHWICSSCVAVLTSGSIQELFGEPHKPSAVSVSHAE